MQKTYTVTDLSYKPTIRLTGNWLKENGFNIGDQVELFNDNGILVLIKLTDEEIAEREKYKKILSLEKQIKKLKRN